MKQNLTIAILVLSASINWLLAQNASCPLWVQTVQQTQENLGSGFSFKSQKTSGIRKVVLTIDSMMKKNAIFSSIPESRLRTTLWISNGNIYSAQVNAKAYHKRGWDKQCGIIPQADRIGADQAGVSFAVNTTGYIYIPQDLQGSMYDPLLAFPEPQLIKTIDNKAFYYKAANGTRFILFSYNNLPPWIPVTIAEYLDMKERELQQKQAEFEKDKTSAKPIHVDDKQVKEMYEQFKKTDAKAAEEYKQTMEKLKAEQASINNKIMQQFEEQTKRLEAEAKALKNFRENLSPVELNKQACLGSGAYSLWTEGSSYRTPLVKMIPNYFSAADKNQIKLITIWAGGIGDWETYAEKALETLNYPAIKALVK